MADRSAPPDRRVDSSPAQVTDLSRLMTGAGCVLAVVLAIQLVVSAVLARWAWLSRHAYEPFVARTPNSLVDSAREHYEPLGRLLANSQRVLFVIAAVLWMAWLYRMHCNLRSFPVTRWPRYSAGWAIGGWFVPIMCWFRPKQMMDDAWRASRPVPTVANPADVDVPWYFHLWWMAWVVSAFFVGLPFVVQSYPPPGSDASTLTGYQLDLLTASSGVAVAAALALPVVIQLTRRHRRWLDAVALGLPRSHS